MRITALQPVVMKAIRAHGEASSGDSGLDVREAASRALQAMGVAAGTAAGAVLNAGAAGGAPMLMPDATLTDASSRLRGTFAFLEVCDVTTYGNQDRSKWAIEVTVQGGDRTIVIQQTRVVLLLERRPISYDSDDDLPDPETLERSHVGDGVAWLQAGA